MKSAFRLSVFLLLLTGVSAAAQEIPYFTSDFPPEEFAGRREKVYDAIGAAALAVVQGAPSPAGYTRFRQTNEFYYLCGVEVPHAYLLLDGAQRRANIYLPHRNAGREAGEGKMLSAEDADEIRKLSGVDAVYGIELLGEHLARGTRSGRMIYTPFSPAEGFAMSRDLAVRAVADYAADPWDQRPSREGAFIQMIRTRFPQYEVRDLTPTLDQLRLIKSERELALIRKATRLSCEAILEAMKSTRPGMMEYELDALAKFIFYRNGAQGEAYYSLIASGRNAWYPHYNAGKRRMQDGDLLLMDFAPDVGYYMSDITRVWPVNGKFNQWQRELYGFYMESYRAILKAIRPGVTAQAIKQEAAQEMEKILSRSKFSKPAYEKAAREFVAGYGASARSARGGLGHWVGMATHDVGSDAGPLRAGMVFTIEPALRVPEEQIYIRMEDLIIITDRGAEIVSDSLPMRIDEIEKVMQSDGLLKKYPRLGATEH
ncbi:MAG TPA: Xaa-Pro peptidase family protein [Blastocatellia bacterium]|nr:Xaa-Pro peptidase family protein [Blastocatellia bacterium]